MIAKKFGLLGVSLPGILAFGLSPEAQAWGGRGHHVICSAAVHLVKNPELKEFLTERPHTMGHLCNVPDIYWKSLPSTLRSSGDPTHYINPEKTGLAVKDVPLALGEITQTPPTEMGTLWWRADQFVQRAIEKGKLAAESKPPQNRGEEQDEKLPYNEAVYEFMVNLGLLGHFVGDAAQPLHNTADYDGYEKGHGGLHSYYEEAIVSAAPGTLESEVLKKAEVRSRSPWRGANTLEKMRNFSQSVLSQLPRILANDPVKKKSELKKEKGMSLRTPAVRESAEVGWRKLKSSVTDQMGSAASLLAHLWDEAYEKAGKPKLSTYRSFRYPFTPDFVAPEYVSPTKPETK